MKTRVFAIPESWFDKHCAVERFSDEDIHDISDEEFMDEAEDLGYCWSLAGFQNELNCEGNPSIDHNDFKNLHFRFIDVEVLK